MGFDIHKNGVMSITRGDTATIMLDVDGAENYKATLSVKRNTNDSDYILQTDAVNGVFRLSHDMTDSLPVGKWVYDIQFIIDDEEYITYGANTFIVKADVTR